MTLRLASYNIRKAVGLDWRRDPHRILRIVRQLKADVVALQEADKRLAPRQAALDPGLVKRETELRVVPLVTNSVSLGWHGNALLVRKDFEIEDLQLVELPGIEPRGSIAVRLATPSGSLTVVGVHLGLRRACRQLQLAKIISRVDASELGRTVVMGDFNEWSNRRGLDLLANHFDVVRPGRSFHAARPVACLDRFALGAEITLREAGVDFSPEARIASDHLPVWADIQVGRSARDVGRAGRS